MSKVVMGNDGLQRLIEREDSHSFTIVQINLCNRKELHCFKLYTLKIIYRTEGQRVGGKKCTFA